MAGATEVQDPQVVQTDPEPTPVQTEEPATEPVAEPAAEPDSAAAVPQLEAVEEKPDYLTRAEWEKEKAEVAQRAAADALEQERRRRQTENARRAQQEERTKARLAQTVDTVKATLVARGFDPDVATDQTVLTAIDRVAQERAEALSADRIEAIGNALDWLEAPLFNKTADLHDGAEPIAQMLGPRLQAIINAIRPQIETDARKDYIHKDELPKHVESEIARRNARAREGQEQLQRVEGQSASTNELEWWRGLTARERQDPVNQARYDRYTSSLR